MDKALKNANAALKAFKRFSNETGRAFAQTILDKIDKMKPKPVPVAAAAPVWRGGPPGQGGPNQGMMQMQMAGGDAGGAPAAAGMFDVAALDASMISEDVVSAKIKEVALAIIGDDADEVEADTPLMEAGLTSSTAVVMRDELVAAVPGVKISPTAMFDYPSIAAMTEMLMEQLGK